MSDAPGGLPRIGAPATRALTDAGYTELGQLAGVPEAELGRLHGMGPTALRLIREALHERGLTLGQPTGSYGEGRVAAEHG
ncbi:MAG TPA: hypothetical protein VGD12_12230 [Blastococcus sp.]|jgi:hypothetical protein